MNGTVTRVFLPRGFAFVRGEDGNDYFLQADDLVGEWDGRVKAGARVEFASAPGRRGGQGPRAINVKVMEGAAS